MQATALDGGFENAPVDAARAFRVAMNVMARPGRIETLDMAAPPAPLSCAAGSLILTLLDHETPVFLAGRHDTKDLRDWIAFHTGAPFAAAEEAHFAVGDWDALLPLSQYRIGTPEYPDRSATLIVEMPALEAHGATLSGPGIKDRAHLSIPDLQDLRDNARLFPLGLDFFLTCDSSVAALPRTTKLEDAPCT